MPERRCAEPGCTVFPDAAWSYCAKHLAEQEGRGAAWARAVAAVATDRPICPQPCEHLSQEDAREGRTCPEYPCTCTDRPDGSER